MRHECFNAESFVEPGIIFVYKKILLVSADVLHLSCEGMIGGGIHLKQKGAYRYREPSKFQNCFFDVFNLVSLDYKELLPNVIYLFHSNFYKPYEARREDEIPSCFFCFSVFFLPLFRLLTFSVGSFLAEMFSRAF